VSAPDDAQRLRIDDALARDEATRDAPPRAAGSRSVVATTTTVTTYPTAAARFYAVTPQAVLGAETEGGSGSVSALSGTFYALNLGGTVPPNGTQVLCTFVEYRWVFRYD
jgi:hypothetical protein